MTSFVEPTDTGLPSELIPTTTSGVENKAVIRRNQPADHPLIERFYSPDAILAAIEASGITLADELALLKEAMEHHEIKVRLKAQTQFRALLRDIKQATSVYFTATRKEDGSIEQSVTMATSPVLAALARENLTNAKVQNQAAADAQAGEGAEDRGAYGRPEYHRPRPRSADIDPAEQIVRALSAHNNPTGARSADTFGLSGEQADPAVGEPAGPQ